ncbi:MAG: murein L,D-transpeptidase catalytic domain family protein [Gammaproteobacteria bacterium]|nr:murein L,D-transpeptidase catalytic domain family protein [Gammaproteobacteria bacterium]
MKIIINTTAIVMAGCSVLSSLYAADLPSSNEKITEEIFAEKIQHNNPTLSPHSLYAGIRAYEQLQHIGEVQSPYLTLVDFTLPSSKKRLWVINMQDYKVTYYTYVAQGIATGKNSASYFSNAVDSHASSIGVYLTGKTYYGTVGHAMRLYGLDKGFNDNAYRRGVVMHSSWHMSESFLKVHGTIGHTWGCFGLDKSVSDSIINQISNGSVLVAYYPDKRWLGNSLYEKSL